MKICVVGAGAIGGLLAVRLAKSGALVTVVDRGAHLQAIQRNGLRLLMADGSEYLTRSLEATANMGNAGPQDVVILAVKTQILPAIAPQPKGFSQLIENNAVNLWSARSNALNHAINSPPTTIGWAR